MKLLLSLITSALCAIGYGQTFSEIFKAAGFDRETEDRMGYSVDISGNYAIIGAYADDFGVPNPNMGSAYIFEKTGIDDWTFVQKINNSDQDDYDRFGWSVAMHGNLAVVGAYAEDEDASDANTLASAGSVYVFQRGVDGVWTQMQKLVASDRTADDEFGWSVDIYDSTIVVGAHHEGHNASGMAYEYHAGSIYVFDLSPIDGNWSQTQKIVCSDRADDHVYPDGRPDPADEDLSDLFGGSVAISGNYIVAGAHNHDYGPGGVGTGFLWNQGAAYIFERSGGVWTEATKIQSSIRKAWDRFGYAVDIDSNIVVIGVYAEDESEFEAASLMNAGGAYIFTRDLSGNWLQTQKLDASDRSTGDHFGRDVAIDGNYLIIGAEQEDIDEGGEDTLSNAGAAYLFLKGGGGVWSEIQKIAPSDREDLDLFGEAVSISEHTAFVGSWQQDFNEEGMVYIEDAGAGYFFSYIVCEAEYSEQDITICAGEAYTIGENSYTVMGTYVDTLLNVDACDSIVTTNLTVIEPVYHEQDISICPDESYTIGIHTYTETGIYVDTLIAFSTCDSIVTTNLTVILPVYYEQDISICSGTTYSIGLNTYAESGTYIDTLVAFSTCDSIVTTNLTIEPAVTYYQEIHLCFGEIYEIGASIYDVTGIYEDSLVTEEGCDSIVTTDLFIEDENTFEQSITICAGESFTVGDSHYTESGVYEDVLESATLCDSTVTTNLTVLPAIDVSIWVEGITLMGGDPDVLTTTFQWITCDPYALIDGATESSYIPTTNGNYAVIITDGDCSDTSACATINNVGLTDLGLVNLKIYPNPSSGLLTVEMPYSEGQAPTITVLNPIGAIVYQGKLTQEKTNFDFSQFSAGVYTIRLTNGTSTLIERIVLN